MSEKSVKRNYIYNLIYQILILMIPLVTTPYVSRILTAEGVGVFSYTTAMVSYFSLFGNLGINTYGQLKIAKNRNDIQTTTVLFYELMALKAVLMAVMTLLYGVFVFFISKQGYRAMYQILIVQILASLFDISWFLQGLEEFKKLLIRNALIKLISTGLIFILIKNKSDLLLYALIMNGANLLGNLSVWIYLPKYLSKPEKYELHPFSHLRACVTYFIPTVAVAVYLTIDKTMIGWFASGSFENGFYEQAHKIEQMAVTAVTSLSIVAMPRMAYLFRNDEKEKIKKDLDHSIHFVLLISIPMCLGLMAVSDRFIPLYLGDGFEKSIVLLKILSLLLIVVGLNNTVGKLVLMSSGKQKEYNMGVIIGAIVNVLLNLILIPKFYSIGAAIASVISESVILYVFISDAKEYLEDIPVQTSLLKYLFSGLLMYALVRTINIYLNDSWGSVLFQILIGIVSYFFFVLVSNDPFTRNEIKTILKRKN